MATTPQNGQTFALGFDMGDFDEGVRCVDMAFFMGSFE